MSLYDAVIADGNFRRWFRALLMWVGVVLIVLGLRFDIYLLALIGVITGSVGMYAAKAAMVNVKPFKEEDKNNKR